MRKRPEIPEDVFFDVGPADDAPSNEPETEEPAATEPDPEADEVLAKSMEDRQVRPDRPSVNRSREETEGHSADDGAGRVGRPPAQEGPKEAVTLYLTEPVAHMLEEVKFRLLTEYDVKTSKSAIADFAIRHGLGDLQAAADDLRRE